jgi:glycosyltransferase involved in cell wall biosynthesis
VAADHGACTYFRMLWPGEALSGRAGLETAVRELEALVRGEERDLVTDVVVIQRPLWRKIADTIPRLQDRGLAVVVDVDDDFAALHPDHPAREHLDEATNAGHLARACAAADLVTAPTQALLRRYAPHGRSALIGNYLPRWALEVADRRNGRTVGWSGVAADHPGDLEDTGGAVAAVLRRSDARFQIVGPPDGVASRLGLDQPAWGTGMLSIRDYFDALGSIDVGIVPLAPTEFNAAKSPLKGIEWGAAGVPFVASPTPEYEWLSEQGLGAIARTPQEWEQKLSELLRDEALRHQLADAGVQLVRERFVLEPNAWRWANAWEQASENRRRH